MTFYLSDIIEDKNAVIQKALQHPAIRQSKTPDTALLAKVIASDLEFKTISHFESRFTPAFQDLYDAYTLTNGEHDEIDAHALDDYESGMDDVVEAFVQEWHEFLSQDWLAKETIDTHLWEEAEPARLGRSTAKEIFKQASYGKEPGQLLANAGIVNADLELAIHSYKPTTTETQAMATGNTFLDAIQIVKSHLGSNFNQVEVYDDIELALDDDEILSTSAGQRLGLDVSGVQALQAGVFEYGDETQDAIFTLLKEEKPALIKRETKKNLPTPPAGEGLNPAILNLLSEHGGTTDVNMATVLGVSRATYNNWKGGKNAIKLDDNQTTALRTRLENHYTGIKQALEFLTGQPVS